MLVYKIDFYYTCDHRVVICYLIRPYDMAVHIIHFISHNYSLSSHTVIKVYYMLGVYNSVLILSAVLRSFFLVGALKVLIKQTRASRAPAVKTS